MADRRSAKQPPLFVAPQLALAIKTPPAGDDWCHEIKLDGYRLHARLAAGDVTLLTRNRLDWTYRYPETAAALRRLGIKSAYLDGEITALRPDGTTSFAALQAALDNKATDRLVYFAFDLLFLDGEDLQQEPLEARKRRLEQLLADAPAGLRFGEHVVGNGPAFLEAARQLRVEGVVSKRRAAPYRPGERGTWRKIKCLLAEEFVIIGFTDPEGTRTHFGALLLGFYGENGTLRYAGRCGAGISQRELARLYDKLKPLIVKAMPLAEAPTGGRFDAPLELRRVHWVKPTLVAAVTYLTWTADGVLRSVTYEGLREDKAAESVVRPGTG